MLLSFNLYDLSILAFVQLVFATAMVLSPARDIGNRFAWSGSRITEVVLNGAGAVAITAVSCLLTHLLWGASIASLESPAYLLVFISVVVIALQPDRNLVGQLFYAAFGSAAIAFAAWDGYLTIVSPHSILETLTASFVLCLDLAAFVVWISNVNYQADVLTRSRRGRPLPVADPTYQPFVSLHMPAYNEPPQLLIESIKALERIDYPNFEIIVMDNNTADPAVWGPVEEYCRDRPRVKFVHVAPWPGYKAGACNLALREYTDPRAEIIGLVDADDIVQPYYLRETAAYFSDPNVGFLQTCESNRDFEGSSYYTACVDSYQAFYLSVMSSRNERDTVPFVGTMGLFRRSALESVGGWNEWCICEDTEASLRVLRDGWSGLYIPRCFGRGVVPPSWAGMITQRHRWCFGAMQILRLHWRSLMPWDRSPDNHLTSAQRRDYLMASLGWSRDLLMLAFSVLLLVTSVLTLADSSFAVAPLDGSRSLLPLSLIIIVSITMMSTLRTWTTLSYRRAALSLVISLGVTFVIARGCIEGVARRDGVFLRTSKSGGGGIFTALKLTRWETALAFTLFAAAGFLAGLAHPPWILILLVATQATAYLCAPAAAVWNHLAMRARRAGRRRAVPERQQRGGVRWPRRVSVILTALVIAVAASAFVSPSRPLANATTAGSGGPWPQSLMASARTEAYLKLGSSATAAGDVYYPITPVHLSGLGTPLPGQLARVDLSFSTASPQLLSQVLRAAARDGGIPYVGIAFRAPGPGGRPVTRLVDTFSTAVITSVVEPVPGSPTGTVSLLLPAASGVTDTPAGLQDARLFARAAIRATAHAYVSLGQGLPSYAVTGVSLSRSDLGAPLNLSFSTTAHPLLERILQAKDATGFPALTLSVSHDPSGRSVRDTFSRVSVSSFAENLSTPFSGTASLAVPAQRHRGH
ncbi:MAG TPA: glycosyltransferase [Gaiellaceae bacterium]|nr:glycosyltransferase [Gaiellaceae bacterium]